MTVELVGKPSEKDYMWLKECAYGTCGKEVKTPVESDWLYRILRARHSPIRELNYRFIIRDMPYWVSVHLVRHHEGVQWYVESQRNDRQDKYDRNAARQDAPVTVRASMNAEALMNIANKRLCNKASVETREVVYQMCQLVAAVTPEMKTLLVPECDRHGVCFEMYPCYMRREK